MSEMIHLHPLVFTLQDAVTGRGFLAGITVTGKAVMEHEDGQWWMYGVCPGAVAGSGETPSEAFTDFRNRYKEALFDMADEFTSFLQFRSAVQRFFAEKDVQEETRWEEALKIVRQNDHAIPEQFKKLPRKTAGDYQLGIRIDRLEKMRQSALKPANNVQDSFSKVA